MGPLWASPINAVQPGMNPVISLVAWKRQSGMVSDRAVLERSPERGRAGWEDGVRTSQTPMSGNLHRTACASRTCASSAAYSGPHEREAPVYRQLGDLGVLRGVCM